MGIGRISGEGSFQCGKEEWDSSEGNDTNWTGGRSKRIRSHNSDYGVCRCVNRKVIEILSGN